jgi:hypothetical protein
MFTALDPDDSPLLMRDQRPALQTDETEKGPLDGGLSTRVQLLIIRLRKVEKPLKIRKSVDFSRQFVKFGSRFSFNFSPENLGTAQN